MAIIFDGKKKAAEIEESIKAKLQKSGKTPKLVSLVIGDENGALKYQEMKKKAGERVGIEVEIRALDKNTTLESVTQIIQNLNSDSNVHGIMIQLPLPQNFSQEDKAMLIQAIAKEKDVDGMREDSPFITPVVKAVLVALDEAFQYTHLSKDSLPKTAIVGAKGFEGKKIVKALMQGKYFLVRLDKGELEPKDDSETLQTNLSNIVISCTGVPNLITGDMVEEGVVAIDAGAPKGDFEFESVSKKASFITPVPGGIGPVTIACLMENLIIPYSDNI